MRPGRRGVVSNDGYTSNELLRIAAKRIRELNADNAKLRKALAAIKDAPGGGPGKRIAAQALRKSVAMPQSNGRHAGE
jgi:hypothetical protein